MHLCCRTTGRRPPLLLLNRMKNQAPLLQDNRPSPLLLLKRPDQDCGSDTHKAEVMDSSSLEHDIALHNTPGHGLEPGQAAPVVYQEDPLIQEEAELWQHIHTTPFSNYFSVETQLKLYRHTNNKLLKSLQREKKYQ